jgi:hypothetical protein
MPERWAGQPSRMYRIGAKLRGRSAAKRPHDGKPDTELRAPAGQGSRCQATPAPQRSDRGWGN